MTAPRVAAPTVATALSTVAFLTLVGCGRGASSRMRKAGTPALNVYDARWPRGFDVRASVDE